MSNKESKCDFCGRKLGLNDSYYGDREGHIFCDMSCLHRFGMRYKDKCTNCNKKICGYILKAKDNAGGDFYFCSENCFHKYNNKRTNNKLERVPSVFGNLMKKINY